jgi:hypothetical protein
VARRLRGRRWRNETTPEFNLRYRMQGSGWIAAFALFAFACAHGSDDPNTEHFDPTAAGNPRHFMVLPVNMTIKTAPEFSSELDEMFGAIAGYIREGGDTIETVSREDATAQWAESIMKVKKSEELDDNFETAMRVYVADLSESRSFDALIAPSIAYRTTKTRDRLVTWDGVFRKIKVVNLSDQAKHKGLARSLEMQIAGVSLHVMVFNQDGELIFQKYGGLDLVHDVDMTGAEFTMSPGVSLKEKLLNEREHVREGIELAFDPYLPKH